MLCLPLGHAMSRRLAPLLGALLISACTTTGGPQIGYPSRPDLPAVYGVERGSVFEAVMSGEDKRAIAESAGRLLTGGATISSAPWSSPSSGRTGTISVGAPFLIGLDTNAGARIPAPAGIDTSVPLLPASGNYKAIKNANVRLAPNTQADVLQTLSAGSVVRGYGHAKPIDWYLIGEADAVLGYVSGDLLEAAGASEPVLAGAKPKRPRLCRDLNVTMTLPDGRRDAWTSLACVKDDGGWEVPKERGLV